MQLMSRYGLPHIIYHALTDVFQEPSMPLKLHSLVRHLKMVVKYPKSRRQLCDIG